MSVGNFYRYFPSKAAIVEAMVRLDLAEIQGEFAEIQTSDDAHERPARPHPDPLDRRLR